VEDAARAYAASSDRDEDYPEAILGRAEMAVRGRRSSEGLYLLDRLDRALEANPRPPAFHLRARLLRARAHLLGRRVADARQLLRAIVDDPRAPPEAWFHLATAEIGHSYRGAVEAYERYLELAPDGYYAVRARRALGRPTP